MGLWTVTQQFTTTSQTSVLFCSFVLTSLHTFFAALHGHGDEDDGCVAVLKDIFEYELWSVLRLPVAAPNCLAYCTSWAHNYSGSPHLMPPFYSVGVTAIVYPAW